MNIKYILGLIAFVVVLGALAFLIARNDNAALRSDDAKQKISVVASFYPLYFFSQQIGGDRAAVVNITPSGAEPHEYEPTPGDMVAIERADVLVLNGAGLEPWSEAIAAADHVVVKAGEGLANRTIEEEGVVVVDPHVWLSPPLAKEMVAKIEQGFVEADPANASYYAANAQALTKKLDELDAAYRAGLLTCAKKDIITSHIAFGYLAAAYHLNQIGITGVSPEEEPSPKQLADIAKFAKANDVKVIFFESLVSPKLAQTIATEIGATTMVLDPLEGLSDDDRTAGNDYFTVMQDNLAALRTALICKP